MGDRLPYATEAEVEIAPHDLEALEEIFHRELSMTNGRPVSPQTKFNYAWGLIRSKHRDDIARGVELFRELHNEQKERKRECTYYLAVGCYRMGDYARARSFNDMLLEKEPHNRQALSLKDLIDAKISKDGLIGLAVVVGAVAALASTLFFVSKRRQSSWD